MGYQGLHDRIRKLIPKPSSCPHCHRDKFLELSNRSNEYLHDLSDWEWLCRSCHKRYHFWVLKKNDIEGWNRSVADRQRPSYNGQMNPHLHLRQTEVKRNARLIKDYNSGRFSMVDLVVKYQISSSRIFYILKLFRDKRGQFAT